MTNTPMTFEDWRKNVFKQKYVFNEDGAGFKDPNQDITREAWQASEANQQAEIEALKRDLYSYMEASKGYVNEIMKQAQTIAELVEALERAKDMVGHEDNIAFIAQAIAKVKGK